MSSTAIAPTVLVADDQSDVLEALQFLLKGAGLTAHAARSVQEVRERLSVSAYDLLLMDLNYARDTTSGREGLDLLGELQEQRPQLPVIVMTGWGSVDTAVEAMRRGARTFVNKPWDNTSLLQTVRREIEEGISRRARGARATREYEDARLIQRALLPSAMPALECCDMAVLWQPASDFGGDFYDALPFGPDRVGLAIGDVAGKGLSAAFVMSNLQASVRAFARSGTAPGAVAESINRALCANPGLRTFVTFFYAVLDCGARTLAFTNAGHNPPLLVHADGTVERLSTGGLLMGVMPGTRYEQRVVALCPGDRLVLFTDGITEAENASGHEFGDTRLVDSALARRTTSASPLLQGIVDDLRGFSGPSLADDATLITVAVK